MEGSYSKKPHGLKISLLARNNECRKNLYIYIHLICFIIWWVELSSIRKNKNLFQYSQTEQTVIFVTLYYTFIRWRWHFLLINVTATFPCNHSSWRSLPQFPANAPDILCAEMSGIPEILCNVQVNHAFLLRVNYENQSVVHNFFDSNLFLL